MVKQSRYMKAAQNGQQPLLTPDSSWVVPTLPDWRGRPFIAIDTETKDDWLAASQGAGWAVGAGRIVGVSAAVSESEKIYLPIAHPDSECVPKENVVSWVRDHLASGAQIIMQKASYDVGWFKADFGLDTDSSRLHDTMIEQYMLDENRLEYGLESICRSLGIPGKDETLLREAAACFGINPKAEMYKLPARYVGPYAEQDAVATLLAHSKLWPKIEEEELQDPYQLEIDLIPMIVEMRRRGIRVDLDYADQLRGDFRLQRDEILKELGRKIGVGRVTIDDVRQNSFKQRLFDAENIPYPRTERGQPSFEAKKMVHLQHWLPKMLVEISQLNDAGEKFISKYIENYAHLGRIHAEIHSTKDIEDGEGGGTATTRLAYSDPPLQQIPSRHPEIGPAIRKIFLPEVGELWGAIDLSQQEFRLITHLASVCKMPGAEDAVKIYNENPNADFHNIVVEITGLPRRTAKDVNFARAYRAGVAKFAQMINKNEDEAKLIYEQYDEKMPFVARTAEFCDSRAQQKGYLRLIDGARAHFDRWESRWVPKDKYVDALKNNVPVSPCSLDEAKRRCNDPSHPWYQTKLRRAFCYKAMNKWVQSSAARQTKIAMRNCWREKIVPMIQLHDELGISSSSEELLLKASQIMRDAIKLVVPVMTDIEIGNSWGTAKYSWQEAIEKWPIASAA